MANAISPIRRRSGVTPAGGRIGGRGPRDGRVDWASVVAGSSSKKSNSMSLSRSLMAIS